MKSLIFPILLSCIFQVNGQNARIGFTAGGNMSTQVITNSEDNRKPDYKPGITVGMQVDIPVIPAFSIQPGLNYVTKGFKFTEEFIEEKVNVNLNYFEVPLNFLYNKKSSSGRFFIGAGPYIAGAIMSHYNYNDENNGKQKEQVQFGKNEESDMRAFDWGLNGTTGFVFNNGLQISGFFTRGLYNLSPVREENGVKIYNQGFGIKLGYVCRSVSGK